MPKDFKTKMGKIIQFHAALFILALFSLASVNNLAFAESTETTTPATLYLSPNSKSVKQGEILTISIREDSKQEKINVVQIGLTYPVDLLEFGGFDNSGSGFNIPVKASESGGKIEVTKGSIPPLEGDQLITKINFRAKAEDGSAVLNFTDDSKVLRYGNAQDIKGNSTGGTYTLVSSTPTATPASTNPPPRTTRKPAPISTTEVVPTSEERITLSLTTPNTQRRQEQSQVGFWVPMLVLTGTLLATTMAASGFTAGGILKHFKFLRPINRFKHYPHL